MSEHGTTSRYTSGCHCAWCRAANAEYQRAHQAKRKTQIRIIPVTAELDLEPWSYTISTPMPTFSATATTAVLDTRQPLERTCDALVAACIDLREAFAAYHQALEEPTV